MNALLQKNIEIPEAALRELCERHGISWLALFGSVTRDDFTPNSDIDMLVEFLPGSRVGLFKYSEIALDLEALLGRKVDLNTHDSLSKYFRDDVLMHAETIYGAA